ncbi:DUF423 domain-containing protein [Marinobacter confluentis]|uniref:DUF423 domain-containing protein n=1 Tax=Marinobacter confluentis TaxID=1697557 RepID=UPI00143D80D9|nr:DUF423 domain-containing protein [Marinobacter confluentis]
MLLWPLILGAALAMTAVMAGAFGAHGLRSVLSPRGLEVFQTAVTYQMNHSLALILVALVSGVGIVRGRLLALAAGFFAAGIVLFSGSLYLLVLTEMSWLGPVTPMGGVCFIVGWALLIVAALKQPRQT